jgi:hypothetical protein
MKEHSGLGVVGRGRKRSKEGRGVEGGTKMQHFVVKNFF